MNFGAFHLGLNPLQAAAVELHAGEGGSVEPFKAPKLHVVFRAVERNLIRAGSCGQSQTTSPTQALSKP